MIILCLCFLFLAKTGEYRSLLSYCKFLVSKFLKFMFPLLFLKYFANPLAGFGLSVCYGRIFVRMSKEVISF